VLHGVIFNTFNLPPIRLLQLQDVPKNVCFRHCWKSEWIESGTRHIHVLCHGPGLLWLIGHSPFSVQRCETCCQRHCVWSLNIYTSDVCWRHVCLAHSDILFLGIMHKFFYLPTWLCVCVVDQMGCMWTCARWKHSCLRHNSSLLLLLWSRRLVRVQHLVDWRCSNTRQTDCHASVKLLMSFCEAHSTCFTVEPATQQFVASVWWQNSVGSKWSCVLSSFMFRWWWNCESKLRMWLHKSLTYLFDGAVSYHWLSTCNEQWAFILFLYSHCM